MKKLILNGYEFEVGGYACFKSDVEQGGKIVAIKGFNLVLENENGFNGDYIGGEVVTTQPASRCWIE